MYKMSINKMFKMFIGILILSVAFKLTTILVVGYLLLTLIVIGLLIMIFAGTYYIFPRLWDYLYEEGLYPLNLLAYLTRVSMRVVSVRI